MENKTIRVDGRCHCGAIEFEAEIDAQKVVICHCTDCQAFSGGPFRVSALTPEDAFVLRKGQPKLYVKTAESGRQRAQGFCGECGSALYATSVGDGPKVYALRTGVLAQRVQLRPRTQIWSRSALAWLDEAHALPSVSGQS
jgi:hypothetical protein